MRAVSLEDIRQMMTAYSNRHMECWKRDAWHPHIKRRRRWYWAWWKYLEAERNRLMEIEREQKVQRLQARR